MLIPEDINLYWIISISALLGLFVFGYLISAIRALAHKKPIKSLSSLIKSIILAPILILMTGFFAGIQGYSNLTHEEHIATLKIQPTGMQSFIVDIEYPNGRVQRAELRGDQVQVDAYILKWSSVANLLGLHTYFQLDRVSGRFINFEQAKSQTASIQTLSSKPLVDLVYLRKNHTWLDLFYDTQYGSSSFADASESKEYKLFVSTTGLLLRNSSH